MKHKKKPPAYTPGWSPPNAVAWCAYHDRGMNYKYIRRKKCLSRGKPCRHLRWFPLRPSNNDTAAANRAPQIPPRGYR